MFISLRYFQLLSNQPTPTVGELTPKFDSNQSACNCVVGYHVVFEVSPSDHSDFCVSVHVVEAYAIWGTGTNSKQQTTISETENVKRRLKFRHSGHSAAATIWSNFEKPARNLFPNGLSFCFRFL